jgi:hypothetical protein
MKLHIAAALALLTANAVAQAPKVSYLPNERFATQIGDIEPMQWKDYSPIQKNVYTCMDDKRLDSAVCQQVQEKMKYALYDALSQAHVINTLAKAGDPKFCDSYGKQLIVDRKLGPAVAYALLIVDERMKYGSSLYGDQLPSIYLGKLVHDSLMESQPCKQ